MTENRVKISLLAKNQLPEFVRIEFPLASEFLSQYYTSVDSQGLPYDLINNIDKYIKLDFLSSVPEFTTLNQVVNIYDDEITVDSTVGFPDNYGLIKINNEIILYRSKTNNKFISCIRGFSGLSSSSNDQELIFTDTLAETHILNADQDVRVENLSGLFLKIFLEKVKTQVSPGFENRDFYSQINERLFIKQSKDFYASKGSDESFKILFRSLYGDEIKVIKPKDYLIEPSTAKYRITKDLIIEILDGDVDQLKNRTVFQDEDLVNGFNYASGSVSDIQTLDIGEKNYYILKLDYDFDKDIGVTRGSVVGDFVVHPKTNCLESVSIGDSIITVESTLGFPNSGRLAYKSITNQDIVITYGSKNYNQFLDCSGVEESIPENSSLRIDAYSYAYNSSNINDKIKFRISSIASSIKIPNNNFLYEPGDIIEIETLGKVIPNDVRDLNLIYNIPVLYNVSSIESIAPYFRIKTVDENTISINDEVTLILKNKVEKKFKVLSIEDKNTFLIDLDQSLVSTIQNNLLYVKKNIQTLTATNYPESSYNLTNIQNTYYDEDENLYIASSSLPNYIVDVLNPTKVFSGAFGQNYLVIPDHKFTSGDYVEYIPGSGNNKLNIPRSFYYVKVLNKDSFHLSNSKANLFASKFINISSENASYVDSDGILQTGKVFENKFILKKYSNDTLTSQRIIRKISKPIDTLESYPTNLYSNLGILNNGVEISNYQSGDAIFYGGIDEIVVTSGGSGYDVINPPLLTVKDSVGFGCSVVCEVEGVLEKINVIDPGFDFYKDPALKIVGGNGKNAAANINLSIVENILTFNSSNVEDVNLTTNVIGFGTYHRFIAGEKIIYDPQGQKSVGGLSTDGNYYVSLVNDFKIKLHESYSDSILGINTINIISYGAGLHKIKSFRNKNKIGSITVTNSGSGYRTKKIVIPPTDVNPHNDSFYKKNHGYKTGEIIVYTSQSIISGLTNNKKYYVKPIDQDNFRLFEIGQGSDSETYYLDTNQYVDLKSKGTENHIFNYEPIQIVITGITSTTRQPILQPIFRGSIKSVFINQSGTSYGSNEIINYNRQPFFELDTGSGADFEPIIINGKIEAILVKNSGKNYFSVPDLIIVGDGDGARITPYIENGKIKKVIVNNSGIGYSKNKTYIVANPTGKSASFEAKIQKWSINEVEKLVFNNLISSDDGNIKDGKFGIQYTHLYSPRELRKISYGKKFVNGKLTYKKDLVLDSAGNELESDRHSPILGFAYDGNPIYGPYGFANQDGTGGIKCIKSSYRQIETYNSKRPPQYPGGYFVEDYYYAGDGDLDEHNGRFCVTPEYPQGIYAYFTTIDSTSVETNPKSPFRKYRKPVFPYFIGQSFKSKPIEFNFDFNSYQTDFDPLKNNLIRNTSGYNFNKTNTLYPYVENPLLKTKKQVGKINFSSTGEIIDFDILDDGQNYKVGDKLYLSRDENSDPIETIKVDIIKGKPVDKIEFISNEVKNIQLYPLTTKKIIGFSTNPHGLEDSDYVKISGLTTSILNQTKNDIFKITIIPSTYILKTDLDNVSNTGSITYIKIQGDLNFPALTVDDILKIDNEKVKILEIDRQKSILKIEREYGNTIGFAHSLSTIITQVPRKFELDLNLDYSESYVLNRTIYFNPEETVSIGLSAGPGIGNTLPLPNISVGSTEIFVPTKTIYIKNHSLETGDKLKYLHYNYDPIKISLDGSNSFDLQNNQELYVVKFTDDFIGLSTVKLAVGSGGTYIPIGTQSQYGPVYFSYAGTGNNHEFKTQYTNVLNVDIQRNLLKVSTAQSHGLSKSDIVNIKVLPKITKEYKIVYNDENRRLIVNPTTFTSSNLNLQNNTITIQNHDFKTGDKVICKTDATISGISSDRIYFTIFIDDNTIKLCENYYESKLEIPKEVNFTSNFSGYIGKVNPKIETFKNYKLIFDLSDESLSTNYFGSKISAFDFKFFYENTNNAEFLTTSNDNKFNIKKVGKVGITSDAKLEFEIDDQITSDLYYTLVPINLNILPLSKKEYIVDKENIIENNKIVFNNSLYNGSYTIVGIGQSTFDFPVSFVPENVQYTSNNADITYTTNSTTTSGSIDSLLINTYSNFYRKIPVLKKIESASGYGAFLLPVTSTIGQSKDISIVNVGFEYPSDFTLRPTCIFPQILIIQPLFKIESIDVDFKGVGYTEIQDLIVVDNYNNSLNEKITLKYDPVNLKVDIISNEQSLIGSRPKIFPINNTNGVGISSATYNNETKTATLQLSNFYSSEQDFPFKVGDNILVENVINDGGNGFNSSDYGYDFFKIIATDPNIGGFLPTITYSLSKYLGDFDVVGEFLPQISFGRVVKESDLPRFITKINYNNYKLGEEVKVGNLSGTVLSWNVTNRFLKVFSSTVLPENAQVIGMSSGTISNIIRNNYSKSEFNLGSSSIVNNNWVDEKGFLNNNYQRIHDSDYYQYFSYSLNSKIPYDTWGDAVNSLVHPSGFKEFSELNVESLPTIVSGNCELVSGICTDQNKGIFEGISDFTSVMDLECYPDFDLAREITYDVSDTYVSNEIVFNSRILKDHFESIGNRVIEIQIPDDVSEVTGGPVRVSLLDQFNTLIKKYKKYITFSQFNNDENKKQVSILSAAHNGLESFLVEYGSVTNNEKTLGTYKLDLNYDVATLKFIPTDSANYSELDFTTTIVSYDINSNVSGISTLSLGNVVKINGSNKILSNGSTGSQTVLTLPINQYRSGKLLIGISSESNNFFQLNEITFLTDTNINSTVDESSIIHVLDYGKNVVGGSNPSGLGTYFASYNGNDLNIKLDLEQPLGFDCEVNVSAILFSDHSKVSTGSTFINTGNLRSFYAEIQPQSVFVENEIANYDNDFQFGAHLIVTIENISTNEHQVSELVVLTDIENNEALISEFGSVFVDDRVGYFTAEISGNKTVINFVPTQSYQLQIRSLVVSIGVPDPEYSNNTTINLGNISISGSNVFSGGYSISFNRSFEIFNDSLPIFRRTFDGSDQNTVSIANSSVYVYNHNFVTGEKIHYSYDIGNEPIGIRTVNVPGIGLTDKLPPELYVVKRNKSVVSLSITAEDALKTIPNILSITSVGVGNSHTFMADKQLEKSLVTVDNWIQSPVSKTEYYASLTDNIDDNQNIIRLTGIGSIFAQDLIKIDDEFLLVDDVGVENDLTLCRVRRDWMNVGVQTHTAGSEVRKYSGNYNIHNNFLTFVGSPIANVPNETDNPDEIDFAGIQTSSHFYGRVFFRSAEVGTANTAYRENYIFDDISSQFKSLKDNFLLTSDGYNVENIDDMNAIILIKDVFQEPQRLGAVEVEGSYYIGGTGISTIYFTGSVNEQTYDINTFSIPVGGVIQSVSSIPGKGYQPLSGAGATAVVNTNGTLQSISIGSSGSGYRPIQEQQGIGVYVQGVSSGEDYQETNPILVGFANVANGNVYNVNVTNAIGGLDPENPPLVIIDEPLSYNNIPLIYSNTSPNNGIGTEAKINVNIGQDGRVSNFEIVNYGYSYDNFEVLTVPVNGDYGIPLDNTVPFEEFKLTLRRVYDEKFSGWSMGEFSPLDPIENLFNGERTTFPLFYDGEIYPIVTRKGSNIDLKMTLLVFINNVLQRPDVGYKFFGGSFITFAEAPKKGDKCEIIFYKGTPGIDVIFNDIIETIEPGDHVTLNSDDITYQEESRLVTEIKSIDSVITTPYSGPGISSDFNLERPLEWCKQRNDVVISDGYLTKDRLSYEPKIHPNASLLSGVGIGSTHIYVDSVIPFFADDREGISDVKKRSVEIISTTNFVRAEATAILNQNGTLVGFNITNSGSGYSYPPVVNVEVNPGLASSLRPTVQSVVNNAGQVVSILIYQTGVGFSTVPKVSIDFPETKYELINDVSYEGDFGQIVGIASTSVSNAPNGLIFQLEIPSNSVLKDKSITGFDIDFSGLKKDYYFKVTDSNVGNGLISLDDQGDIVCFGDNYLDNIYKVIDTYEFDNILATNITVSSNEEYPSPTSIENTYELTINDNIELTILDFSNLNVLVSVQNYGNVLSGIATAANPNYFGNYSWGKITATKRSKEKNFKLAFSNDFSNFDNLPIVRRTNPLAHRLYKS